MINTYQKYGRKKNKVQIVTYIDGPFFAEKEGLSMKEQQENLRQIQWLLNASYSPQYGLDKFKELLEQR